MVLSAAAQNALKLTGVNNVKFRKIFLPAMPQNDPILTPHLFSSDPVSKSLNSEFC